MELGKAPVRCLRKAQNADVSQTSAHTTKLQQTILPSSRRIPLRRRRRTLAGGRPLHTHLGKTSQTSPTPNSVLLMHLHPHGTKLRHIRKRTASRDEIPHALATILRMDQGTIPHSL